MAEYTLPVFSLSDISTSDPDGFSDNGGYQFAIGTDTVTISPSATSQDVTITDWEENFFDDDAGGAQVLTTPTTINGTPYGAGTNIEAEYLLIVQDSVGTQYTLQFVSMNNDAWNIEGFTVHGALPPAGEALTIVARGDAINDALTYASALPSCFAAATRIATPDGWREVRHLRAGDRVSLAYGGTEALAMVLKSREKIGGKRRRKPVRLRAGSLGPNCPAQDLTLSPQHRVFLPALGALVPARALTELPRIGLVHTLSSIDYVHLVLRRHAILLAEGCPAESFWPGAMSLAGLSPARRLRIRAMMGSNPQPAAPFLSMKEARAWLRESPLRRAG
ncbi:Hint domain-containing protein [Oceanicola sp. 502str15]|uniref:Hint domain-containing protein n=1 Tax=Oceanicola sp. 502str15 TaxID=2696061 RepID=UPI0020954FEF|nr:Hint domain-containing protein [Oceanicola sp. 502str15]MCO6381180.1 hypothetical protein [Oceanicola sp. 502str15]